MPEGDTLRRLAGRITERFAGQRVLRSVIRDPRIATVDFRGRVLVDADAYGKHLFLRFDDGRSLHAHLLLSGSFEVGRPSRDPEWHRRIELWLENGRLTGVSVPVLEVIATADEHTITDVLGPDLCAIAGPPDVGEVELGLVENPPAPGSVGSAVEGTANPDPKHRAGPGVRRGRAGMEVQRPLDQLGDHVLRRVEDVLVGRRSADGGCVLVHGASVARGHGLVRRSSGPGAPDPAPRAWRSPWSRPRRRGCASGRPGRRTSSPPRPPRSPSDHRPRRSTRD